jgi:hypothetical protein
VLPVVVVVVARGGGEKSRKADRKDERHTLPLTNPKKSTYLEAANVQFLHFVGANLLAGKPNLGAKMIMSHVVQQRAAIQQGPCLAAHARQERLARDLH